MATIFVHDGSAIDYTPGSAVAAGDVVVQGDLVGVAKVPIPASTLGALAVAGVFDFPKGTGAGTDITAGAKLYWDGTNGIVSKTDGGGTLKLIGKAVKAATTTDTTARVRLSQ